MRKKIIVRGPALSASGYGEQTRFALRSLRKHQQKFDIFLINLNWGRTGHILDDGEERNWIEQLIGKTQNFLNENGPNSRFDVSLQVTIPNEFEALAPVNVGYTAGIESTKAVSHWIEKCNSMNRIIVPSTHSKTVFENSVYPTKNEIGQETVLKTNGNIDICGYAAREITAKSIELDLKTDFNFLTVVQWGPRKNLEATIGAFITEFSDNSNIGLIVKTNMAKNNFMDKIQVENRLKDFTSSYPNSKNMKCKIYLLHGNLDEQEMKGLYTHPKVKALITSTHGEGFGLPVFESVLSELPVIAPAWSGHVDFLFAPKKEIDTGKIKMKPHFTKIDYDIGPIQKDAQVPGILQEDSQWCFPKNYSIRAAMKEVYKNHPTALSKAKKLREYVSQEFEANKQYDKFVSSITRCFADDAFDEPVKTEFETKLESKNVLDDIIGL